jgi:hypothetical protein
MCYRSIKHDALLLLTVGAVVRPRCCRRSVFVARCLSLDCIQLSRSVLPARHGAAVDSALGAWLSPSRYVQQSINLRSRHEIVPADASRSDLLRSDPVAQCFFVHIKQASRAPRTKCSRFFLLDVFHRSHLQLVLLIRRSIHKHVLKNALANIRQKIRARKLHAYNPKSGSRRGSMLRAAEHPLFLLVVGIDQARGRYRRR